MQIKPRVQHVSQFQEIVRGTRFVRTWARGCRPQLLRREQPSWKRSAPNLYGCGLTRNNIREDEDEDKDVYDDEDDDEEDDIQVTT
jgi:hypothetical protein